MDEKKVKEAIEFLQRKIRTLDAQKEYDEYCNPVHLKDYFNVRDLLCICLCGWFSPVIIFVIILLCYIADKFESRKCSFREWLYDILYKIANVGVNQKENKKKED